MFTVRIDGKEAAVYQFKDIQIGDFFACESGTFIKCYKSIHGANAINLKTKASFSFASESIVDPISIEWGDEEDVYSD